MVSFRSRLLLPFLLLAPMLAPAQDPCAVLEAEAQEATALRDSDPAAGLQRAEAALAEAREAGEGCAAAEPLLLAAMGSNLHILGRIEEAVARYREALERLPDDATPSQIATVQRGAGVALAEAEEFEAALQSYLAALAASRAAGDRLEAGKTAGNVGNLYNTLADYELSRRFHEEALQDFEAVGFKPGIAGTLINLGALAAKLAASAKSQGDEAGERREAEAQRDFNQRAMALFTELGNERGIAYASANIGMALERLGELEQALEYHRRALELRQRIGDAFGEIHSYTTLASTLTRLGRFDAAQQRLDAARERLPEGNIGLALDVVAQQASLDEARGDVTAALRGQKELNRLRGQLAGELHDAQLQKLQSRYRFDQQAAEIELLRHQAEITELQVQRQRMVLQAGLVVAALLGVVVVLLYSRLRMGRTAARELERMARTDALTGLPNRRDMAGHVAAEVVRAQRSGRPFCLLMIDVDGFKAINDSHGHACGDRVLIEVARRLRSALRSQDLLARWGGEELLVLLPETRAAGAAAVAEKLRAAVAGTPVDAGASVPVSVTLGVAEWQPGMDADACVRAADAAMYAGKRQGGNRVLAPGALPA